MGGGVAIVFIALGSNLGDRQSYLGQALQRLGNVPETKILRSSRWYETTPVGGPPQGMFLNGMVQLETALEPLLLLHHLQRIEKELGRPQKHVLCQPRVIDLDLLSYDDRLLNMPGLIIPHPRMHERPFVLAPLAEIAPQWHHPRLGKTVVELLQDIERCESSKA